MKASKHNSDAARTMELAQEELSGALLYEELGRLDRDEVRAALLKRLAAMERAQAEAWLSQIPGLEERPTPRLRLKDRFFLRLARVFGVRAVLPLLTADALKALRAYHADNADEKMVASEAEVAESMAGLERTAYRARPTDQAATQRSRLAAQGSLRAAVFGVNDGLVSNLSLVMGVAGASPPNDYVLLAGFAGLLAGSFSMAAGEYISMLSQRELLESELEAARRRISREPDQVREQLAEVFAEKGVPPQDATRIAGHLSSTPERALDTLAREQLGVNPDELGSPRAAALASFTAFAAGAAVPPLPFLLLSGWEAVIIAGVLSALALFAVGLAVSLFTTRSGLLSGLRMLAIGAAAAVGTFLIGSAIGASVGI